MDDYGDFGEEQQLRWMGRQALGWWSAFTVSSAAMSFSWVTNPLLIWLLLAPVAATAFVYGVYWSKQYRDLQRQIDGEGTK